MLDKIKYWLIIILETVLFIFIIVSMHKYNTDKINVLETNIIGYKDSLKTVELKTGELVSYKQSLILNNDALQKELNISKKEINELEKTLNSKISQISKLNAMLNIKDTIYITGDTAIVQDDITRKLFNWNDTWTNLSAEIIGKSILDSELALYNFNIKVPLVFGVNDDYKIWVKSPNPYLIIEDISSATIYGSKIYPKKNKWSYGLQGGIGPVYDIIHNKTTFGFYIGAGIEYNF